MQIELSDFIRTRKLDHQLCMSRQTHQIWRRMIWVDCSTLYVLDTIISWKLKCVSVSWNAERKVCMRKLRSPFEFPLWSLLMQRGHLQPSLRAGGLQFLIAELHRSPSCSLVICNVIAENSAPTLEGRGVSTRSCLDYLYWLNTVLVHCIVSPPLYHYSHFSLHILLVFIVSIYSFLLNCGISISISAMLQILETQFST